MIVPVRCPTCGLVVADKYRYYQQKCKEIMEEEKKELEQSGKAPINVAGPNGLIGPSTAHVLNDMGIKRICCRRVMITSLDAMHRI